MFFLALALLLPFPAGAMWIALRKEKERSTPGQSYLMGALSLLAVAQAASFISIKLQYDLTGYCRLLVAGSLIFTVVSLIVGRKSLLLALSNDGNILHYLISAVGMAKRSGQGILGGTGAGGSTEGQPAYKVLESMDRKESSRIRLETLIIITALIFTCATCFVEVPDTGDSTMAETVITTVQTGTIHRYHPLTGTLMERGIYPVYKLHSLPLLYSALARISGIDGITLIYRIIPIFIVILSLSAMMLWGEVLSRGMKERKALFLMFYAVLVLFRGGVKGTYAYVVTREAFKGKGLLFAVLVPLFFCGIYLFRYQGERLYGTAMSALSLLAVPMAASLVSPAMIKSLFSANSTEWSVLVLAFMIMALMLDRSRIHWRQPDIVFMIVVILCAAMPESAMAYAGLAFGLTRICDMAREWGRRRAVYIGSILIICLYGTVAPFRSQRPKLWERDKYDEMIMNDIYQAASEHHSTDPGTFPVVVARSDLMERCRLEGRNTRVLYGKDLWHDTCTTGVADEYLPEDVQLYNLMQTDYLDPDLVAEKAAERGVNILVLRAFMDDEVRERLGYREPVEGPGYALYVR